MCLVLAPLLLVFACTHPLSARRFELLFLVLLVLVRVLVLVRALAIQYTSRVY